jgi:uncharacterized protein
MTTIILAFVIMMAIVIIMAIGVIFSNKPIKGSCGGMSALGMEVACEICGGDQDKCDKENESNAMQSESNPIKPQDLSYDASEKN